jgi:transposase-like protein
MSGDRSRRYRAELRERAVRMVSESRSDHVSEWEAMKSVASKLGIGTTETVRQWVRSAEAAGDPRAVAAAECSDKPIPLGTPHLLCMRSEMESDSHDAAVASLEKSDTFELYVPSEIGRILTNSSCWRLEALPSSDLPSMDVLTDSQRRVIMYRSIR